MYWRIPRAGKRESIFFNLYDGSVPAFFSQSFFPVQFHEAFECVKAEPELSLELGGVEGCSFPHPFGSSRNAYIPLELSHLKNSKHSRHERQ